MGHGQPSGVVGRFVAAITANAARGS
jgi:hypothetical protein